MVSSDTCRNSAHSLHASRKLPVAKLSEALTHAQGLGPNRPRAQPHPPRPGRQQRETHPRNKGKLHRLGIGQAHARTPVLMLIQDLDIHIINAKTGELLRELTLDPTKDYQPQNKETPEP